MSRSLNLRLLVEDGYAWLWDADESVPAWTFTVGNPRRQQRRWRMLKNALKAYVTSIEGATENTGNYIHVLLAVTEADVPQVDDFDTSVVSQHELRKMRDSRRNHIFKINTPFVSCNEMDWFSNPYKDKDSFLYVDASFYRDGPHGVPCAAYAIQMQGEIHVFDLKTATSSVDAEVQGLQHAIMLAYQEADKTGQVFTVFADCSVALTKIVLRKESKALDYLGEKVFVQWTPGHQHAPEGMVNVDRAARDRVRVLAGTY